MLIHTYTQTHKHKHTHIHMHTFIHTCIHTYTHAHNCLYIGWGKYPNLFDNDLISDYEKVAVSMAKVLDTRKNKGGKAQIIFSGCGTSGRYEYIHIDT